MKSKSLLIIGGTGFFGKSILDYFTNHNSLKINKYMSCLLSYSKSYFEKLNKTNLIKNI